MHGVQVTIGVTHSRAKYIPLRPILWCLLSVNCSNLLMVYINMTMHLSPCEPNYSSHKQVYENGFSGFRQIWDRVGLQLVTETGGREETHTGSGK